MMEFMTPEDYKKAAENGIPYNIAYARWYMYGWSVEKTVNTPIKKRGTGLWPEYKELCEKNGIIQNTFYGRIKDRKMTPYEAATTPIVPHQERSKKGSVRIPLHMFELAKSNGISGKTLKYRVYQYDWDVEIAATKPIDHKYNWRKKI
jgi:hypothetical protein